MTAGISSATEVRALRPSEAVITLICSLCRVIWTILRTVGLSSTTNTVGSPIKSTSFVFQVTRLPLHSYRERHPNLGPYPERAVGCSHIHASGFSAVHDKTGT